MKLLNPIDRIAYAELTDLCAAAKDAVDGFPLNGRYTKQKRNDGSWYWYFRGYDRSERTSGKSGDTLTYVGRGDDPTILARVADHEAAREIYRLRRELVARLKQAGLPFPGPIEGRMLAMLKQSGLLDRGAVVAGTVAFQSYAGLLGMRFRGANYRTLDLDIAQPRGLLASADADFDLLPRLQAIDPSYRPIQDVREHLAAGFINAGGYRLEFLKPASSAKRQKEGMRLSPVKGLAGIAAQELKFLEFSLEDPVTATVLYDAGLRIPVPDPARFAIHKLMVAALRSGSAEGSSKVGKDIDQAQDLIMAFAVNGEEERVGRMFTEAWSRGRRWRQVLARGCVRLADPILVALVRSVRANAAFDDRAHPFGEDVIPRMALRQAIGEKTA